MASIQLRVLLLKCFSTQQVWGGVTKVKPIFGFAPKCKVFRLLKVYYIDSNCRFLYSILVKSCGCFNNHKTIYYACLTICISALMRISSLTTTAPASVTALQVKPNSFLLILPVTVKPAFDCP